MFEYRRALTEPKSKHRGNNTESFAEDGDETGNPKEKGPTGSKSGDAHRRGRGRGRDDGGAAVAPEFHAAPKYDPGWPFLTSDLSDDRGYFSV